VYILLGGVLVVVVVLREWNHLLLFLVLVVAGLICLWDFLKGFFIFVELYLIIVTLARLSTSFQFALATSES